MTIQTLISPQQVQDLRTIESNWFEEMPNSKIKYEEKRQRSEKVV